MCETGIMIVSASLDDWGIIRKMVLIRGLAIVSGAQQGRTEWQLMLVTVTPVLLGLREPMNAVLPCGSLHPAPCRMRSGTGKHMLGAPSLVLFIIDYEETIVSSSS